MNFQLNLPAYLYLQYHIRYQTHFSLYSLAFRYKRRCRNRNRENDPPTKKRKYLTTSFFYLPIFFFIFSSSVPVLLVSANKINVFLFWNRPRYWSGTGIGSWIPPQQNRSNPTWKIVCNPSYLLITSNIQVAPTRIDRLTYRCLNTIFMEWTF